MLFFLNTIVHEHSDASMLLVIEHSAPSVPCSVSNAALVTEEPSKGQALAHKAACLCN